MTSARGETHNIRPHRRRASSLPPYLNKNVEFKGATASVHVYHKPISREKRMERLKELFQTVEDKDSDDLQQSLKEAIAYLTSMLQPPKNTNR